MIRCKLYVGYGFSKCIDLTLQYCDLFTDATVSEKDDAKPVTAQDRICALGAMDSQKR